MTVHLLGAGSSPGCYNFTLKRTAENGEREFGARGAETLRNNFEIGTDREGRCRTNTSC